MNTRAKGRRIENKAKKELEEKGWNVTQVKGSTKWNKNVDFFGLFDLIAIRDGNLRFIQVKSNRKPKDKPFNDFFEKECKNDYGNISVEIWVWKDRKSFKKYVWID